MQHLHLTVPCLLRCPKCNQQLQLGAQYCAALVICLQRRDVRITVSAGLHTSTKQGHVTWQACTHWYLHSSKHALPTWLAWRMLGSHMPAPAAAHPCHLQPKLQPPGRWQRRPLLAGFSAAAAAAPDAAPVQGATGAKLQLVARLCLLSRSSTVLTGPQVADGPTTDRNGREGVAVTVRIL